MKLVFPNKEHDQIELSEGETSIGRDAGSDILLDFEGIASEHSKITISGDGAFVSTNDASNITRVNGNLVVVKTPVRGGDALLFGTIQCQVVNTDTQPTAESKAPEADAPVSLPSPQSSAEELADEDNGMTRVRMALPQFVLRGVSDDSFGKVYPVMSSTIIGRHSECDICLPSDEISRRHAKITLTSKGLLVEDLGSSNGTFVNGKRIDRAKLRPGDELKIDTARFLVQTPGSGDTNQKNKTVDPSPVIEAAETEEGGSSMVKWAIIGTVLIVASVAGLKFAGVI